MGVRVPRITLKADFGDESAFGELNLLSVGYGMHQAWVFATMFGTATVFGAAHSFHGLYDSSVSLPYLISSCIYIFALIFMGLTNQRFLKAYTTRNLLCAGAIMSCVGTLLLMAPPSAGFPFIELLSGLLTGIGSAVLIIYWGTAFARCDSASIVLNTAVAITISICLFATVLHYAPFPVSGIATAVVPLLELAILWKKTPEAFFKRNDVPIFKPLPINQGKFLVRFGVPVLVLGLALGMLRSNSLQNLVTKSDVGAQPILMLAAGCATVIILITIVALGNEDSWSRFFQPLVPFIAVTIFFIPFANDNNTMLASMFMLVGFLCFESLMWIFFGDLSQRFRLSPIFVFGIGRGFLALAILVGTLVPIAAAGFVNALPFGGETVVLIMLLVIVFAYALLPREREIEAIVAPCPLVKAVSASFERQAESEHVAKMRGCGEGNATVKPAVAHAEASEAEQTVRNGADNVIGAESVDVNNGGTTDSSVSPGKSSIGANASNADDASKSASEAAAPADPTAVSQPASSNTQPHDEPASHPADTSSSQLENAHHGSAASAPASAAVTHTASTWPTSTAAGTKNASANNDAIRGGGRFRGKCETVANTFLLSRRETEILFFLAKGHNAAYIQEKLYISEGTAKTHIRHIYRKCDVHNQQDLMRMVEDAQPTE